MKGQMEGSYVAAPAPHKLCSGRHKHTHLLTHTHTPVDGLIGSDVAAAKRAHLLEVHHDEVVFHVAPQDLPQLLHQLLINALRPGIAVPFALHTV